MNKETMPWWALVWISITQLMLVADATIMNIAVPSAQADLGFGDTTRLWVITAYIVAFGSLLLIGGRIADLIGRRRALLIGLTGFSLASLLAGFAPTGEVLVAGRALQGISAALIAPSALALLSITFPQGPARFKAFAIFGTIMGTGSGVGVLLGGALTELIEWRWAMLINVPIAIVAGLGVARTVTADARGSGSVDFISGVLSAAGLTAVILGLSVMETDGVTVNSIALILAGAVAVAAMVLRQRKTANPLMPLSLFDDRKRVAAFVSVFTWGVGVLPAFLFLSVFLQRELGYNALIAGIAFLPYTAIIIVAVRIVAPRLARLSPRGVLVTGLVFIVLGLAWLTGLNADSSYALGVLPSFLALGVGTALINPTAQNLSTHGAGPRSGVAGAINNTSQQVGGSIGLGVMGAIAATSSVAVDGYARASLVGAIVVAVLALVVFAVVGRRDQDDATTPPAVVPARQ